MLRFFAQTSNHETGRCFVEDFREEGRKLFEARPNMAPVQNLVAQIVYEVGALDEGDLVSVQEFAVSKIDELCKQSEDAVKESARRAATLIGDYYCLASCSDSSTVCETFRMVKQQGKSFKVVVAESISDDGKFSYGETMAAFVKSIDVPAEVFSDNAIRSYVPETECVLVGADSLLFDGSVINGKPTHELAVAAKELGIPFYSVCETSKANTLSYLGKNVDLKEDFDVVSSNLITAIITEKGLLEANRLVEIMKANSKFFEAIHNE